MKILDKFKKDGSFLSAISILAIGSIFGQIVGFAGSMAMTRLFSKENIGIMTLVISVTGMFGPVINGRFDYSIIKEQNEERVFPTTALSVYFGILASFVVSLGSAVYFVRQKENASPAVLSLFVLLILIITAFTNVYRSYNNRIGDYKTMTWVIVIRKAAEALSMAIFGLCKLGYISLLVSCTLGQIFGIRQQTKNLRHRLKETMIQPKEKILEAFRIHKRQLYFSTPATLLNSASYYLLNIFVENLYGLAPLAVYSISFSVLGLPLSVISSNVSKVYFADASKEYERDGSFTASTKKTVLLLLPLTVIIFLATFFVLPILVPIVYGSAYSCADIYIKLLAPMFAVRFISSSITTAFVVSEKQSLEMILQGGFLLSAVAALVVCKIYVLPITSFLAIISFAYSVMYLIYIFIAIGISRNKKK